MNWPLIWQYLLIGAISAFAILSLWVIVAGFGDIKKMFADLRQDGADEG